MPHAVLTNLAKADLEQVADYIAVQSCSRLIATRFLDAVNDRAATYAAHPKLGERCPGYGTDLRQFSLRQYVFFYRPIADGIEIVRILHGSRDLPSIMHQDDSVES